MKIIEGIELHMKLLRSAYKLTCVGVSVCLFVLVTITCFVPSED